MPTHALVVNEAVVRTGNLPKVWPEPGGPPRHNGTSVSRYDTLPSSEHLLDGWLPLTENFASLGANQHHGLPTFQLINGTSVTANYPAEADSATVTNLAAIMLRIAQGIARWTTFLGTPVGNALNARRTAITAAQTIATTQKANAFNKKTTALSNQAEVRGLWAAMEIVFDQLEKAGAHNTWTVNNFQDIGSDLRGLGKLAAGDLDTDTQ